MSAPFALLLMDGKRGKKGRKKMNVEMVAASERRKEKINKIILLFPVDNKINLVYNNLQSMTEDSYGCF